MSHSHRRKIRMTNRLLNWCRKNNEKRSNFLWVDYPNAVDQSGHVILCDNDTTDTPAPPSNET